MNTDHFLIKENDILFRLSAKSNLRYGAALFYYHKSGNIQRVLHLIKFNKRKDLAFALGQMFGFACKQSKHFNTPDGIISIPVHWRRRMKRGFNQSEEFAKGIASVCGIKIYNSVLLKGHNRKSQTSKGRLDRFDDLKSDFCVKQIKKIKNKSVLLVDDVLTTGATLEAAIELLSQAEIKEIQIGLMAIALN